MPPRSIHLLVALGATVVTAWAADGSLAGRALAVVAGTLFGSFIAHAYTQSLDCRIDPAGGLVLYVEDAFLHAWLLPLALLALSPVAFGSALVVIAKSSTAQLGIQWVVCGLAAAWLGHDAIVFLHLRRLSEVRPLHVQTFYGRSAVGPQGMLGRTAVVVDAQGAHGVVRVGGELWKARTLDQSPLEVGRSVAVRRIDGLVVGVERTAC